MANVGLSLYLSCLVVLAYRVGARHFFPRWQASSWGIGGLCGVLFVPWYVVLRASNSPEGFVLIAMASLVVAFSTGRYIYTRRYIAFMRQSSEHDANSN